MDVEAIFGHVDADEDGGKFVHDPTLRMRAQAQAAVRVRDCEGGGRTKLCPGLASPRGLTPTLSLAGFVPAGNRDIQGGPSSDTT